MSQRVRIRPLVAALVYILAMAPAAVADSEMQHLLAYIRAVGREGAGNVEAARAWRELVRARPHYMPEILAAFDGADQTAANWLRTAVDAIAEGALRAGRPLPAAELEAFIQQKQHDRAARRLAYDWLARVDPNAPRRLLPGMLHDPSPELRRDAVEQVLQEAQRQLEHGDKSTAIASYQKALLGSVDRDQIDQIARALKSLGTTVDLPAHFGLIQHWMVIGPFDSRGGAGFQREFRPERTIELASVHEGKNAVPVRWAEHTTHDPYGVVNLNQVIGKHMGAAAYAFATVTSPTARAVQVRAGSNNAVKIFLNGQLIFAREEYHHGNEMDQHIGHGVLKAGGNEILIKVCQNEQKEDWAQSWSFQLRVCDAIGAAVPFTQAATKAGTRSAQGGQ